jgi:hypothetical protein
MSSVFFKISFGGFPKWEAIDGWPLGNREYKNNAGRWMKCLPTSAKPGQMWGTETARGLAAGVARPVTPN